MLNKTMERTSRRCFLLRGAFATAAMAGRISAQGTRNLQVASAGSIRGLLDDDLKTAAAKVLHLDLSTQSGGAYAVARAIVAASLSADVFIPVTAGPMLTVMSAGKIQTAYPIAKTEMVIIYSPKSRFAAEFAAAAAGTRNWWEVLQMPGLRIVRSNPMDDPSGRSMIFTMMLAAKKYGVPDLVQRVLGAPLNPAQIQPGTDIRAGLENGSIDAIGGYKVAAQSGRLSYIPLPNDVNLSEVNVRIHHPDIFLSVDGTSYHPEPLLFYAGTLQGARNPAGAAQFLDWLRGIEAAPLFTSNGLDLPDGAGPLTL